MTLPSDGESERQRGSHLLLRETFRNELDYVRASLRRLGVARDDVEDLAQEVFVQVYRRIEDYDPARPIRPWLFAFAFRCASDYRRLAHRRVEVLDELADRPSGEFSACELLEHAEDRERVERALDSIDMGRRAVFVLYELDECPMREVARSLGIPLFTAYSRLRAARREFRAALKSRG